MLRLRQVALAAWDLQRASDDIRDTFDLAPPFSDPGVGVFGLRNVVFVLGDTFLEVVSPVRDDAAAARFLERKGGDAGYMAIFQTDDLARERRRLEALGVRIVFETSLDDISTIHLHPRDIGAAIVSIDEARPPESWRWAGEGWEGKSRSGLASAICGVEIGALDTAATSARWAEVLARPVAASRSGERHLPLEGGAVRFVPCEKPLSDGITAVEVKARDWQNILARAETRGLPVNEGEVTICATRFRLATP